VRKKPEAEAEVETIGAHATQPRVRKCHVVRYRGDAEAGPVSLPRLLELVDGTA